MMTRTQTFALLANAVYRRRLLTAARRPRHRRGVRETTTARACSARRRTPPLLTHTVLALAEDDRLPHVCRPLTFHRRAARSPPLRAGHRPSIAGDATRGTRTVSVPFLRENLAFTRAASTAPPAAPPTGSATVRRSWPRASRCSAAAPTSTAWEVGVDRPFLAQL